MFIIPLCAGDMEKLDALKRLAVFSNYAPLAITPSELQVMAANTTGSTIRTRAQMTPRTFDISNNAFDGWFPEWLVEKVAECKEDITLILDVRACPLSKILPLRELLGLDYV